MAASGVVDGAHLDFESYGFTGFDQLGDYLCYCDDCFGGFVEEREEGAAIAAPERYQWLQDRSLLREYLAGLRDRSAALYRAAAAQIRAVKPDFVFSIYPDFAPGEVETCWRTAGVARGLHAPSVPMFVIDASHYWPNHDVPWWDSSRNAIQKLGMRHILGTWTGGLFGDYPTLDVSAEQWLYDAAVSHDGNWVWFEHVWGPNDLRTQRAAHRRIRAVEIAVGSFLTRATADTTFATVIEQSGERRLGAGIMTFCYTVDGRHAVRVCNVNTDRPAEVRVRFPHLAAAQRWTVQDPLYRISYATAAKRTVWTSADLREGIWLSMEKRSDLWLLLATATATPAAVAEATVSGAPLRGHKPRPKAAGPLPAGVLVEGVFPLAYVKPNPLEYYGTSGPSINPVLGSSVHWVDADTGRQRRLFGIDANSWEPALSPDRRRIAFSCWVNGRGQIYVMNADGTNPVNISRNEFCDRRPVWAPDGTRLAFESERDGDWDLYTMAADGSAGRRLTDSRGTERAPAWAPDGTHIAGTYEKRLESGVFTVAVDGTELTELVAKEPLKIYPGGDVPRYQMIGGWYFNGSASCRWLLHRFRDVQWAPDGAILAFRSDMDPSGYTFVYTVPAAGGAVRRLDETLAPAGKHNKPIPIRSATGTKKTWKFAESPPEEARYLDGSAYTRMIGRLQPVAALPVDGWRFQEDPRGIGTGMKDGEDPRLAATLPEPFYSVAFRDRELPLLRTDTAWDEQGFRGLGEGWYRQRWTCPELAPGKRLFLHIGAVDESVWLYVDGRPVAWYNASDPGLTWDKPLLLEISGVLTAGAEHLLVLRVKNVGGAGGIWKPITLMAEQ